MLVPVEIPPGIFRNGTKYQTSGRWYDGNQIRWYDAQMRPVGGWTRVTASAFSGKARAMLAWEDNSDDRWLALGTSTKLLVTRGAATIYDITPAGFVAGTDDPLETLGYGGGNYGAGTYGTAREGGTFFPPNQWVLDTWGQNLVGVALSDGELYEWSLNVASPAVAIANSPTDCLGLIVSDERHLIAFGAGGNKRKVEWSDRENNTVWTPASDNEAGGFELQTEGSYMSACRVRGQILVTTNVDAHAMRYVGGELVYQRERVGASCGCVSRGALIGVESQAFWMGPTSFWVFDGAVVQPLPCDVSDYVFSDIDDLNGSKVTAGHNWLFGEVWWFYPSEGATEPDRYVLYNYRERHWSIGDIPRTAWTGAEVFGYPHAAGTDNFIYRHEDGFLDNGASRFASLFAESGALEISGGERVVHIIQVLPDEKTRGENTITFNTKLTPGGTIETTFGPYVVRADGYTDTRVAGRQFSMRLVPTVDDDWRVGKFRFDVFQGGKR